MEKLNVIQIINTMMSRLVLLWANIETLLNQTHNF